MSTKAWLALGGAGAASASAAGGYYAFSSKGITIKEALKDEQFIPEGDTAQWGEEFKSDKENIKAAIKELSGVDDNDGGIKLRDWCKQKMTLASEKNPQSLELVRKYCLIRDLASQLLRTGKNLLTEGSLESDWKATYTKRKSKANTRGDIGLAGDSWNETEDLVFIKSWCGTHSEEAFLASDNNSKYTKLLKWCTKEGAQTE
ncbi:hypothetical protein HF1_11390 [Mycoplasma haemofelis str. Langford 1]|uniref:Uncharacterized protein n=1 Tax=Mycoplasma haemofelis (strain Langford 1) TaxID=941640 RepID=E8ZJ26_MYCHL|nr:hypothetical protein [Mycoplasma haemofelis]CBY93147.1 hypothetical protein HF1_11390 [Mycoplasma haemofelis str. Langford 1]